MTTIFAADLKDASLKVAKIKDDDRAEHIGTWEELIEMGYHPCGSCQP